MKKLISFFLRLRLCRASCRNDPRGNRSGSCAGGILEKLSMVKEK